MPTSVPVPSKGALRALRNLALGTSCTVAFSAGLLTEDRRRRINTAREIHKNATKLKSAKQYHNTGKRAIESFEQQTSKLQDDAYWLPSNVLQDAGNALRQERKQGGKRGLPNSNVVCKTQRRQFHHEVGVEARLAKITSRFDDNLINTSPASPSLAREPSRFGSKGQLATDITNLLNLKPPNISEATAKFLRALSIPTFDTRAILDQDVVNLALDLNHACIENKRWDLGDQVLVAVLAYGRLSEEDYEAFKPAEIIHRLIALTGSNQTSPDPTKLQAASSIYLASFTEEPKPMSWKMLNVGSTLCSRAMELGMDNIVESLVRRINRCRGDSPPRAIHKLITVCYRQGRHKDVCSFFFKYYTQTFPPQQRFYHTLSEVMPSAFHRGLDVAEQVLNEAARLAVRQNLLMSTTHTLSLLGEVWRTTHDIDKTCAVFDRMQLPLKCSHHPWTAYTAMVQFCVEAGQEDTARKYHIELCHKYPAIPEHARCHEHFALARAKENDWPGVWAELISAHQHSNLEPSNIRSLSHSFTPILHEYAKTHSLSDIEDYISMFDNAFGLKIGLPLLNFMVEAYGREQETESMARWIQSAVAVGCDVDASTINIILRNCHYRWKLSIQQIYDLAMEIRAKHESLFDYICVSLLRQIVITSNVNTSFWLQRLEVFDKQFIDHDGGTYRSMSMALKKDPAAALEIYKRSLANNITLEAKHLKLAIRASLSCGDGIEEITRIISDAKDRRIDISSAVGTIFITRLNIMSESSATEDSLVAFCHSTITAFEESKLRIPLGVVTHTASMLTKSGFYTAAIDVWNTMSTRLGITPASFDLASISTLLSAYIGLQDPAGVRWATHMLSANKITPDSRFRLHLNNARRKTSSMLKSQECSAQVHTFLDSIMDALQQVKVSRQTAVLEREKVKKKTFLIIEKAINDRDVRDGLLTPKAAETPKLRNANKALSSELGHNIVVTPKASRTDVLDHNLEVPQVEHSEMIGLAGM